MDRKTPPMCKKPWGTDREVSHPGMSHVCGENKGHSGKHICVLCGEEK